MRIHTTIAAALIFGWTGLTAASTLAKSELDLILMVDPAAFSTKLSQLSLDGFLADLHHGHRIGIVAFGKRVTTVRELNAANRFEARAFFDTHLKPLQQNPTCKQLRRAIEHALNQLTAQKRERALRGIVVMSRGPYCETAPIGSDDTDQNELQALYTSLRYNEIPIYAIALGDEDSALLRQHAVQTEGRYLGADLNTNLFDVLVTTYGHLQHLAAKLSVKVDAPQSATPASSDLIELGYTVEKALQKASAERAVLAERLKALSHRSSDKSPNWSLVLVGIVTVGILAILAIQLLRFSNRTAGERPVSGSAKDRSPKSATFSNLKLSASRLVRDVAQLEKRCRELNLDLEDFGIEIWETQNRLELDYNQALGRVFLLMDHLQVQTSDADQKEATEWIRQKLERLLADERIERIEAEPGDTFDGEIHNAVGDEKGPWPVGTIAAVVRPGYIRIPAMETAKPSGTKKDASNTESNGDDAPAKDRVRSGEILRQVEVIVSRR